MDKERHRYGDRETQIKRHKQRDTDTDKEMIIPILEK